MLKNFQAFQLAKEFHWACKKVRIADYFHDQLLRASSSIALNTAEGSGKRTPADQRRFYGITLGSLRECDAILQLESIEDPVRKRKRLFLKHRHHPLPHRFPIAAV